MVVVLGNNRRSVLRQLLASSDTLVVVSDSTIFPTLAVGEYFYLTILRSDGASEIVKVLSVSGASLTVVRAQEGTAAREFPAGSGVEMRVTAASVLEAAADAVDALTLGDLGITATAAELNILDGVTATTPTLNASVSNSTQTRDTVAALLADTTLTYTAGQIGTVTAGGYVRTRSEGFSYQVAASGASDHHVTTAGGVKLYVLPGDSGYNVLQFGATGDGATDDSSAIQLAINIWLAGDIPATLVFPTKTYRCGTQIVASPSINTRQVKAIIGYGALFTNVSASSLFRFSVLGKAVFWENLRVSGLQVSGGPGGFIFEGGDRDFGEWIWYTTADSLTARDFTGNGFELRYGFFESQFYSCSATALSSNQTGHGFLLQNGNDGIVSSIDLFGCNTRYGKNGVRTVTPGAVDTKIHGGTFLLAWEEGIYMELATSCGIFGAHVEDNYQSGSGSIRPGAYCIGSGGVFSGIYGTSRDPLKQNYTLRLYAGAGEGHVVNGGHSSGQVKFGHYSTAGSTGSIIAVGATFDQVNPSKIISLNANGAGIPGLHLKNNFIAYAASVTPNLESGSFIQIGTLTGNITINNPTFLSATPTNGTMLEVLVTQDATGGRTVTFGSSFRATTAVDTTANRTTIWTFRYLGTIWREVAANSTS